ncbi:MAG: phosphate acyltransferase PlsX [Mycoplasmataceae bacterium]|nr:phosphate acyltransferase PlsX [Mycoplasmataceae bacterium]
MKKIIAFDLSSGDKGSIEAYKAAVDFSISNQDWKILGFSAENLNLSNKPKNLEIIKCKEVITQQDGVLEIRRKKDSTLIKTINSVLEKKADAAVSAAASGPLVTSGYLMFKSIKGIKPSFAPILETSTGEKRIFLDVGANIGADAQTLNQYAMIGTIFAKELGLSKKPIVKQLNIGSENKKGTSLQKEAFILMSKNNKINFQGNIESNELFLAKNVQVVITEAFAGNIAIKSYEGAAKQFKQMIKSSMNESFFDKIGFSLTKTFRNKMKKSINGQSGGAAVLGLNELLIKAHGSSDSELLVKSLEVAKKLIKSDLIKKIKKVI